MEVRKDASHVFEIEFGVVKGEVGSGRSVGDSVLER